MKLIDFKNKKFSEISKLLNPAYDIEECLLLCKAEDETSGLYVLLHIEEDQKDKDEVKQLCLFWDIEMALKVSNFLSEHKENDYDLGYLTVVQRFLREVYNIDITIHRSFSMKNSYHFAIIIDNNYDEEIVQECLPNRSYEKALDDAIKESFNLIKA